MLKKMTALICALALIASLTASAYAAPMNGEIGSSSGGTGYTSGNTTSGSGSQSANSAERQQIRELTEEIKQNRIILSEQSTTNSALREECRNTVRVVKESGSTITEETQQLLTALNLQLREQYALLNGTKGQVNSLQLQLRQNKLNGDFGAMIQNMESVIAAQEYRIACKEQINCILQEIVDLLSTVADQAE
jgi:Spy/CpxP family protein refolding chaperone